MIIGYAVGVFDLFHSGHKNLLDECLKRCDELIIGVHTNEFVKSYKRLPNDNENKRKYNILNYLKRINFNEENIHIIDDNHLKLIKKYNINIIFHGNDWELESYKKQIKYYEFGMDKLNIKIDLIDYSKGISTTEIMNGTIKNLKNKKCFLFDLDNTLILNKKATKYSTDLITKLENNNKDIYIITNNNRYTPREIYKNLKENCINIGFENIITTLIVIKDYLLNNNLNNIFVWGTKSAKNYFINNNFVVNENKDKYDLIIILYRNDFDYQELTNLCNLVKITPYIIGNIDATYPDKQDALPDTGSIWKLVEYVCDKKPIKLFGKPEPIMINNILKKYKKNDIIFIGDSEKTDKQLAKKCEIDFIRVHEEGDISHMGVLCDYF
jgi:4-nitrophenyl phosphatase